MPAPTADHPLVVEILSFLAKHDAPCDDDIRRRVSHEVHQAGDAALVALCSRLERLGADWTYYPPDPLARRLHDVLAVRLLAPDSAATGGEHLTALAAYPVVIAANHLSYSDANLVQVLLSRIDAALADRLTVVAGPKVYATLTRRFSSLCFGTIRTPQSSGLANSDSAMSPREAAQAARRSIEVARDRLAHGEALVVFPEGTRSRSGAVQPMLPGVARYLEVPELRIVPMGITGTGELFPVGEQVFRPVTAALRVGRPMRAETLRERAGGNRRLIMDCVGLAIAQLLPPMYRGAYADDRPELEEARSILRTLED